MFIVSELHRVLAAPEERNVAEPILACNISLLWSCCLWVMFHIYKHSTPPELKRLVAVRPRCVIPVNPHPTPLWLSRTPCRQRKNPLPDS